MPLRHLLITANMSCAHGTWRSEATKTPLQAAFRAERVDFRIQNSINAIKIAYIITYIYLQCKRIN